MLIHKEMKTIIADVSAQFFVNAMLNLVRRAV